MSATQELTALTVEKLKPNKGKRIEVPDGGRPGLYLVIQRSGTKSWAVRYRHEGRPRKVTLRPTYPALGLSDARAKATAALREVAQGRDPAVGEPVHRYHQQADPERALFALPPLRPRSDPDQ